MEIKYRRMRLRDLSSLLRFYREIGEADKKFYSPNGKYLPLFLMLFMVYFWSNSIAEDGDKIVGFVFVFPNKENALFVHENYRKLKIGSQLMLNVDCEGMWLRINPSNVASIEGAKRLGFSIVGAEKTGKKRLIMKKISGQYEQTKI